MAKVSIITTSYNYECYIKETIESVIAQSYQDWEMIIVDDGSKDNSREVIKNYCKKDNRIKLYTHPDCENRGLVETLKLGISKSTSSWLIFLESDDTITSDYIDKKIEIIKKYPDIKLIYNDVQMFGDEERIKEMEYYFQKLYQILNNISFPANVSKYFYKLNLVPTFSCVMLKKEILNGVALEPIDARSTDLYLLAQLAINHEFYFINEKLTNWRMNKNSYINKNYCEFKNLYFQTVQIPDILFGKKLSHRLRFMYKCLKLCKRKIFKKRNKL